MSLGRNQLSFVSDYPDRRVVWSVVREPLDIGSVVAKDRPTFVVADEILVSGAVATTGFDLNLLCRIIQFAPGSVICTTGSSGTPSFPADLPAVGPREPGSHGADGANGGVGGNAGNVQLSAMRIQGELRIDARGAPGGRAQDGGTGAKGPEGPHGVNLTVCDGERKPERCNGGSGGAGGAAGLPGFRGAGGSGGRIVIRASEISAFAADALQVLAGMPGDAGTPGAPGRGGDGGLPGTCQFKNCEPRDICRGRHCFLYTKDEVFWSIKRRTPSSLWDLPIVLEGTEQANGWLVNMEDAAIAYDTLPPLALSTNAEVGTRGTDGDGGSAREPEVQQRQEAPISKDGDKDNQQLDVAGFASMFEPAFLDLALCSLENDYRSEGNAVSEGTLARVRHLLDLASNHPTPEIRIREIRVRTAAIARKIELGLDFYGYSMESAPLLSFDRYSEIVGQRVLPQLERIETSFNAYWDAKENREQKRSQVRDSVAATDQTNVFLEVEQDRTRADTHKLLNSLTALDERVRGAFLLLLSGRQALDAAIKKKNNACDLVGSLTAVATIVAGVASGGAGFLVAAGAASKLKDDLDGREKVSDLWDDRKVLGKDLEEIGKGANTVAESIEKIRKGVEQLSSKERELPQFRMEREQFDKVAKEFVDLPEAAPYREAGYDYLKAVETRNRAIIDYNALLVQLMELQAKEAATRRVKESLRSVINGLTDPAEPFVISLMTRVYMDTLSFAAQMVHAEKKALSYHFARPAAAPVQAFNAATIAAAHLKASLYEWVAAKERYEARRELEPGQLTIELKKVVSQQAWTAFMEEGILAFTLRFDHPDYRDAFESLRGLRITGISLVLEGAKAGGDQDQVWWQLTHGGSETIYPEDRPPVHFSHRPIKFSGSTSLLGNPPLIKPDFSEKELYAGVSPFAAWLLALRKTAALDLSHLQMASFKIAGYMIDT